MSSTGEAPDYIPPHLNGATDFRDEEDGTKSFSHPKAYYGRSPHEMRIKLGPEQYKNTFDLAHRFENPETSRDLQFDWRSGDSFPVQIQKWLSGKARGAYDWGTSSQGKSIGTGGLLAALAAGGLGAWSGRRQGGSGIGRGLLFALLGGAAGAGATAYGQHKYRQSGGMKELTKASSQDVTQALIRAVENDYMLSRSDRSDLLRGMARMQEHDRSALYRAVRVSIGAGAGAIIGRFLKAKGLLPTILGGIVGALIGGGSSAPKPSYNRLGQLNRPHNYR